MSNPFIDGYMDKEALFGLDNVGLLAVATLGLSLAVPGAVGMGVGYSAGRLSSSKSPGLLKAELKRQELQELRNELVFNQKLDAYKRGTPEPRRKEIHI